MATNTSGITPYVYIDADHARGSSSSAGIINCSSKSPVALRQHLPWDCKTKLWRPIHSSGATDGEDYRIFSRPSGTVKIVGRSAQGCTEVKDWLVGTKQVWIEQEKQTLPRELEFEMVIKGETAG